MASGLFGVQVPRKGLRVRIPCPPLRQAPPSQRVDEQRLADDLMSVTMDR